MGPVDEAGVPAGAGGIAVEVVFSPAARRVMRWLLRLPEGSTAAQALSACEGLDEAQGLHGGHGQGLGSLGLGIWGRKAVPGDVLRDGDRLELYRPLIVDPKEARRQRYRKQGEKLPKGIHRSTRRVPDMTQAPGSED